MLAVILFEIFSLKHILFMKATLSYQQDTKEIKMKSLNQKILF